MNDKIKRKWRDFWATLGIRHLGVPPEEYIPSPQDRCEYGFTNGYLIGHKDGVSEGRHEAIEVAIGLLYHQYETLRTFHGKGDDRCLVLKNCIHEIRNAQAQEMDQ